jgi:hypothetical protein
MQFRIFAEQNLIPENLESIAHTLVAETRVYFAKLESRQVHGFPFSAAFLKSCLDDVTLPVSLSVLSNQHESGMRRHWADFGSAPRGTGQGHG